MMFFQTLIQTIPRGVFELFFFVGLAGMALYLYRDGSRKSTTHILLWVAIFFAVAWRVGFVIASGRYASILIYPLTIFSAYCCWCLSRLPCDFGFALGKRVLLGVNLLLVFAFLAICCLKLFSFDPYVRQRIDGYRMMKESAAGAEDALILTSGKEQHRTHYYTGIEVNVISVPVDFSEIKTLVQERKFADGRIFLDIQQPANAPLISVADFGKDFKMDVMMVYSSYANARKTKKHRIYRLIPRVQCLPAVRRRQEPPRVGCLTDGGVEKIEPQTHARARRYGVLDRLPAMAKTGLMVPCAGGFGYTGPLEQTDRAVMDCPTEGALAGKRSLYFGDIPVTGRAFFSFSQRFPAGAYRYGVLLKGQKGTRVELAFSLFRDRRWLGFFCVGKTILQDERAVWLESVVDAEELPEGTFFHPTVLISGGTVRCDEFLLEKQK